MKKTVFALLAALGAFAARAHFETVELADGECDAPAGRTVSFSAISTNLSATVTVKRVTSLSLAWWEERLVVSTNYSDLVEFVTTNKLVYSYETNVVGGVTNVATNVVANVATLTPVTNRIASISFETSRTRRVMSRAITNNLASVALSGGAASTNLASAAIAPGDRLVVGGLVGGRAFLTVEK